MSSSKSLVMCSHEQPLRKIPLLHLKSVDPDTYGSGLKCSSCANFVPYSPRVIVHLCTQV